MKHKDRLWMLTYTHAAVWREGGVSASRSPPKYRAAPVLAIWPAPFYCSAVPHLTCEWWSPVVDWVGAGLQAVACWHLRPHRLDALFLVFWGCAVTVHVSQFWPDVVFFWWRFRAWPSANVFRSICVRVRASKCLRNTWVDYFWVSKFGFFSVLFGHRQWVTCHLGPLSPMDNIW